MTTQRKPRVAAPQAKAVLIEATISLLRELPVVELSTRKIEERSGLDRRAITRQFGGELELFFATLEELGKRASERWKASPSDTGNFVDEDLKLRTDLLAYLIISGVDPERLKQIRPSNAVLEIFMAGIGLDPETPESIREPFMALVQAVLLSSTFFGPSSSADTLENRLVIFRMLRHLASQAPELPAVLGLDRPTE